MTILIIVGMALITFLCRFVPLLFINSNTLRVSKVKAMLDHLPLAVLSALIVPGIFQVDPDASIVGIASGVTAVILVLIQKMPLLLVILGSVTVAVIMKMILIHY